MELNIAFHPEFVPFSIIKYPQPAIKLQPLHSARMLQAHLVREQMSTVRGTHTVRGDTSLRSEESHAAVMKELQGLG